MKRFLWKIAKIFADKMISSTQIDTYRFTEFYMIISGIASEHLPNEIQKSVWIAPTAFHSDYKTESSTCDWLMRHVELENWLYHD